METDGLPGTCVLALGEEAGGEYAQVRAQARVCSLSGRLHAGVQESALPGTARMGLPVYSSSYDVIN